MMRTLVVAGLVVLGLFALAPAADAQPVPCTAYIGPSSGYVACCPVGLSVSYGGTYYCVPPH